MSELARKIWSSRCSMTCKSRSQRLRPGGMLGGMEGARGELILQQKMPLPEPSNKDFSGARNKKRGGSHQASGIPYYREYSNFLGPVTIDLLELIIPAPTVLCHEAGWCLCLKQHAGKPISCNCEKSSDVPNTLSAPTGGLGCWLPVRRLIARFCLFGGLSIPEGVLGPCLVAS